MAKIATPAGRARATIPSGMAGRGSRSDTLVAAIPDGVTRGRVCFVAPFGLGVKTTVWARTLPLAQALVQRGWTASILIPPWDTPGDAGRCWVDGGVEVVNVASGGGTAGMAARLVQGVAARRPDIVHVVKPRAHAGLVQFWLWQQRRVLGGRLRIVLDVDDWEQAWGPVNGYAWPLARFLAWQEEWGIRHADGVTAASRWLEARVGQVAPGTPVLYLPNGIAAEQAAHTLVREPVADGDVLFFTRFVEVSPTWLAAFWQALRVYRPSVRLLVAGTPVQPGLDAPFRAALARTGGGERVTWLGFVNRETLAGLYPRVGCAIFPAEPVPLQEAKCSVRLATTLLAGLPVVASAVGEQANYGAEGAARLVAAEAGPAGFALAVNEVLGQPAAQAALGQAARARLLSRYDWGGLGDRLAAFYAGVVG